MHPARVSQHPSKREPSQPCARECLPSQPVQAEQQRRGQHNRLALLQEITAVNVEWGKYQGCVQTYREPTEKEACERLAQFAHMDVDDASGPRLSHLTVGTCIVRYPAEVGWP